MTSKMAVSKPKVSKAKPAETKNTCEFCKVSFVREETLLSHACEKKRRWLSKDDKHNKVGFMVFHKFYAMSIKSAKPRTYEDFMNSKFYNTFVSFGKYLMDIQAINPEGFVEFLIKATVPVSKWQLPFLYEQYIRELNKKETALAAVERNILLMEQWSRDTDEPWYDFFGKVNTNVATQWIRSGRLSPWVLYTADTAVELFERLTDEQIKLIEGYVNPLFWQRKLADNPKDVELIRQILSEAKL